jgi:predicted Zn-dependent protease
VLGALGGTNNSKKATVMAVLGLGAQFGVLMPFSRLQESESDLLGLDLIANAGFDPRESTVLWENMSAGGAQQPPEFMSTHPSHDTRIQDLQQRIPAALEIRQRAQNAGRSPSCTR